MSTELHVEQLGALAEVLLGIAYADGRFEAREADAIRGILSDFAAIEELPEAVVDRVEGFDPQGFSVQAACERLGDVPRGERGPLLSLLLAVADADHVRHRKEEHYFYAVARAIGAEPDEYADLLR